jgi:CHAT domain-containing protein
VIPTVVSFFWRSDDLLAFVARPDGTVETVPMAVTLDEAVAVAGQLQNLFSWERLNANRPERTTDMSFVAGLRASVADRLVAAVGDAGHVVISPHGPLHDLPLHVIGTSGPVPTDLWPISYTPNLALYQAVSDRPADVTDLTNAQCLATPSVEDPDRAHDRFSAITQPAAAKSRHAPRAGLGATKEGFLDALLSADLVAVACHGRFDAERPKASGLLLSDGHSLPSRSLATSDHTATLAEILAAPIRARLVILAACLSGRQRISSGDEPIGFVSALLSGGADAVLAANWNLDSRSASVFLGELMKHWSAESCSLGEATRAAYEATRARYPHPFHWAAFSLYGNERLQVNQSPPKEAQR